MRKIVILFAFVVVSAIAITYSSCSNDLNLAEEENAVAVIAETRAVEVPPCVDPCRDVQEVRLLAGQHYEAGKVYVVNNKEKLFVAYEATGDWKLKVLHLFVGACDKLPVNKQGNLVPGQFPYKVEFNELQNFYYFEIPLSSLPEGCVCVAAHAEVVKVVNGKIVQSETAFGEGVKTGKNWFMKFEYCIQECPPEEPPVDVCYKDETAWAAGSRYVAQGNWATYTPYVANTPINIYAGQSYLVGTVTFSPVVDGKVTITLAALNGAILQDVAESVKIQGYNTAPSGNPAPGLFTTYKGKETTIIVEAFAYYGIHLDVRRVVDCE
ncbi:MAG: hypothetical protein BGO33_04810 [Bacteroidia bacterium 43-41]|nr:MAG: hypothetical protein BGO33_04810 [Bacteroidia bacterium 43-41]